MTVHQRGYEGGGVTPVPSHMVSRLLSKWLGRCTRLPITAVGGMSGRHLSRDSLPLSLDIERRRYRTVNNIMLSWKLRRSSADVQHRPRHLRGNDFRPQTPSLTRAWA